VKATAPADAKYLARSILDGRQLGEVSATDLERGWKPRFDTARPVTIVELKRQ
jgi:hypothetical protein